MVGPCSALRPQFLWGGDYRSPVVCRPVRVNSTTIATTEGASSSSTAAAKPLLVLAVDLRSYTR